ncbi:MAG: PAS domain S-box protein [Promethearchaeia archaeon]
MKKITNAKSAEISSQAKGELSQNYANLDRLNDLIFVLDKDLNIRYINTNDPLEKLNYDPQELVGKPISAIISRNYKGTFEQARTKHTPIELQFKKKGGGKLWYEILFGEPNHQDDTSEYILSCRDITQRKKNQEAINYEIQLQSILSDISTQFTDLKNIEKKIGNTLERLGTLSDSSRVYIFLYDLENEVMSNEFEWCAKGINSQIDELQELALSNFPWWINKLEKDGIIRISSLSDLPNEAKSTKQTLKAQDIKSLLVLPLHIRGKVSGFIGFDDVYETSKWTNKDHMLLKISSEIISNAIERNQVQKRIRSSEKKYREILENIKEIYFEVDLKGNLKFFNNALPQITGYSKDTLLTMNFRDLIVDEHQDYVFKKFNQMFRGKKGTSSIEFNLIVNDGDVLTFESSTYLKHDSQGKIIGFYGFGRDITEKKKYLEMQQEFNRKLEKEVEKRTEELNEALEQQKLYMDEILKSSKFKSEFLATMSHELRTPLNAIIGFTDLLLQGVYGALNEEQEEFVEDIKSSAEHQFDMIKQILNISKIESGQLTLNLKKFSLTSVVNQLKSSLRPLYKKKGLSFIVKGLGEDKQIVADPIRFKEILLNLLSNAIKFTMEGKITLIIKEGYNSWKFKVKDTGIGIAKEDFDKIFKEFGRVDSAYVRSTSGTGLGLSLTKRLVHLHEGEISFNSLLGMGSVFKFTISKELEQELENNN